MIIRLGYDSKPTRIRISPSGERAAEVWIEQEGLQKYPSNYDPSDIKTKTLSQEVLRELGHSETLAYATLDELLDLKAEITATIQELVK